MGRHHHQLKLPDHLYLSPPILSPPHNSIAASLLSVKSVVSYTTSVALLQETAVSARAVGDKIPGFRTSATFYNTLRANLSLETDSHPNSLANTPDCLRPIDYSRPFSMASAAGSISASSPSPLLSQPLDPEAETQRSVALENADPLANVPSLITKSAASDDDKVEALHLIADTVAQQRQLASRAALFHPITLCIVVLMLGLIYQYLYRGVRSDLAIVGTTAAGALMATLIVVRWLSGGYIDEAEQVGTWVWLDAGRKSDDNIVGVEDEILLTRFGDEVIGTICMRGVKGDTSASVPSSSSTTTTSSDTSKTNSSTRKRKTGANSPTKATTKSSLQPKALIRAWSVKNRYRHKGIGTALLEEAVKLAHSKGWSGPEFASDHANSKKLLPAVFNGGFFARERKAHEYLEKVKADLGASNNLPKRSKR